MNKTNVYEQITNRIIALLEKGVVPWQQPWRTNKIDIAKNILSKKPYSGSNFFITNVQGYTCPYWGTFNQIKQKGGKVKKEEKGTPIFFWKPLEIKEKNDKGEFEKKTVPIAKLHYIFNLEQCEGIEWTKPEKIELFTHDPITECEALIAKYPIGFSEIMHKEERAFYHRVRDFINMPEKGLYNKVEDYYQTLFHESIHATGHEKRLNRKTLTDSLFFGDKNYSHEELVAELGASFMSALAGIDSIVLDNSASYISNWIIKLRSNEKLFVQASSQAQKAVNYLVGTQNIEEEKELCT